MQTTSAGGYVDFSRFADLREHAGEDNNAAVNKIADEFEALFVDMMLKAARDAASDDGLFSSQAMSTYREMLDRQLAHEVARVHDFGIGGSIRRDFGQHLKLDEQPDSVKPSESDAPQTLRRYEGATAPLWQGPRPVPSTASALDRDSFAQSLHPHAASAAQALGVNTEVLLAQAALETGWGEKIIRRADGSSSHNYFGIKAGPGWRGEFVQVPTTEYVDGRAISVKARFRAYPDAAAAFADYAKFIQQNPRYQQALAQAADSQAYASQLANAGYATDPDYASKIIAIMQSSDFSPRTNNSVEY